jgi:hypothetical protein
VCTHPHHSFHTLPCCILCSSVLSLIIKTCQIVSFVCVSEQQEKLLPPGGLQEGILLCDPVYKTLWTVFRTIYLSVPKNYLGGPLNLEVTGLHPWREVFLG